MCTHGIEEVTIVRYNQYYLVVTSQEVLEPVDGLEIKVVGRFIEQQDIGVTEERLCQEHTYFLVTVQFFYEFVVKFFFYTQVAEQLSGIAFGIPAIHFCKKAFEFAGFEAVFFAEVFFGINSIFGFHYLVQYAVATDNGFQYRHLIELVVVLLQYAHTHTLADLHLAGSRIYLS